MASYCAAIIARAWRDTSERFSWSWHRLLDGAGAGFAGILVLYFARGQAATMDRISVGMSFLAGMLGWATLIFLYNLVMAPCRIWLDDRTLIASLSERITPSLALSYDDDTCKRWLHDGSVARALAGNRMPTIDKTELTLLIRVRNTAEVPAEKCQGFINCLEYEGQVSNLFFEPVQLLWMDGLKARDIPPDTPHYLPFIVQPNEYDKPYLAADGLPFDYNFLFTKAGTYVLHFSLGTENRGAARLKVQFTLNVHNKVDNNGKSYSEYELSGIREI